MPNKKIEKLREDIVSEFNNISRLIDDICSSGEWPDHLKAKLSLDAARESVNVALVHYDLRTEGIKLAYMMTAVDYLGTYLKHSDETSSLKYVCNKIKYILSESLSLTTEKFMLLCHYIEVTLRQEIPEFEADNVDMKLSRFYFYEAESQLDNPQHALFCYKEAYRILDRINLETLPDDLKFRKTNMDYQYVRLLLDNFHESLTTKHSSNKPEQLFSQLHDLHRECARGCKDKFAGREQFENIIVGLCKTDSKRMQKLYKALTHKTIKSMFSRCAAYYDDIENLETNPLASQIAMDLEAIYTSLIGAIQTELHLRRITMTPRRTTERSNSIIAALADRAKTTPSARSFLPASKFRPNAGWSPAPASTTSDLR